MPITDWKLGELKLESKREEIMKKLMITISGVDEKFIGNR